MLFQSHVSSDFPPHHPREYQIQPTASAEGVQHGAHGKEERAEKADDMLGQLLTGMKNPGQERGGKSWARPPKIDPKIMDRKGSWRRYQRTDRCW